MLTITTINGIDTEATRPPAALYVASRERVRAGKGVLQVKPRDWIKANGEPWAVQCGRSLYTLSQCHTTPAAARAAAQRILHAELVLENRRYADIKSRLAAAAKAIEEAR